MAGPAHLALNLVFLVPGAMGGMERYVRQLVPGLAAACPEMRITAFVHPSARRQIAESEIGEAARVVTHPLLGAGSRAAGELLALGPLVRRQPGIDLLHSLAMTGPLSPPCPHVVTIGDVIWVHHPASLSRVTTTLWRVLVPPIARRSNRVITFTDAARRDIVASLRVPTDRVDVVAPGSGLPVSSEPSPEGALREWLGLGDRRIVLTVSILRPHKNLERLVAAMTEVTARAPDAVLVMPGRPTPYEPVLRAAIERAGMADSVKLAGFVDERDLEGLYRAAACFVFPSLQEGFGLPVLEALRRGVPVACSAIPELLEVAGDAALTFDPTDPHAIAEAILALLNDPVRAQRLARAGPAQAQRFTVEAMVEGTLHSYAAALTDGAAG